MMRYCSNALEEIESLSEQALDLFLQLESVEKIQFRTVYRRELKRLEIFARNSAVDIHAMGNGRIQKALMENVDAIHDLICREQAEGKIPEETESLDDMIRDGKEKLEFYAEQICEIMEECIKRAIVLNDQNAIIKKQVDEEVDLLNRTYDEMMDKVMSKAGNDLTDEKETSFWLKGLKSEFENLQREFLDFVVAQYPVSLKKCIVCENGAEGVPLYIRDHAFDCRPLQKANFHMTPVDWWKKNASAGFESEEERRNVIEELSALYRQQMDEQITKVEHRYTRTRQASYESELGNYNVVQDTCKSLRDKLDDRYHFEYNPEPLEKIIER